MRQVQDLAESTAIFLVESSCLDQGAAGGVAHGKRRIDAKWAANPDMGISEELEFTMRAGHEIAHPLAFHIAYLHVQLLKHADRHTQSACFPVDYSDIPAVIIRCGGYLRQDYRILYIF